MRWLLHGCPACGGDLHDDVEDAEWLVCFMCARSFRKADLTSAGGKGAAGSGVVRDGDPVPAAGRRGRASPETLRRAA